VRTISADAEAILSGNSRKVRIRLSIKDTGGTFRDLTTYPGINLLKSVTWKESIDDPGITWQAELALASNAISLSPLMTASPLNRQWNPATAYAPLIQVGREVKIEWQLQAQGDPQAGTWQLGVHGYLDVPDWSGEKLSLTGRGLEAKLIKAYGERERLYAFAQGANATKGVYVWPAYNSGLVRTFAVGDLVVPTDAKRNGHFYKATAITTGIIGSGEPTWPTGGSSTVVDGGVTWTEAGATSISAGTALETVIQQYLDDNVGGVTLSVPASPAYAVKWFKIDRQAIFTEVRALADLTIGWCCRYLYDSGSGTFKLTLYDPNRTTTTSLRTFTRSEVIGYGRAAQDVTNIRNAIRVVYSDSQDLDTNNVPKRKAVEVTDSTSIAKYERQFAEMQESSVSNIDTSTEATALANAALSDLSEPNAEFEPKVSFFPYVELPDLITLQGDDVHFDSDQKLGVVQYEHTVGGDEALTKISVRGKPASGGPSTWLSRMADSNFHGEVHANTVASSGLTPVFSFSAQPGGSSVVITNWGGGKKGQQTDFELHLSPSAGFTAGSGTFKSSTKGKRFDVSDLVPGVTYYGQIIPTTWNDSKPVRGEPSAEFSFVAGFVEPVHINPETVKGPTPQNGGFEGWFQGSGVPPDNWSMVTGTWTREIARASGTDARSGKYGLQFTTDTTTAGKLRSAFFPVLVGSIYALGAWVKKGTGGDGTNNIDLAIEWYDEAKSLLSTSSFTTGTFALASGWVNLTQSFAAPASAQYARVYVAKTTAVNFTLYVDDVSVVGGAEAARVVGASGQPAFANSWAAYVGSGVYAPPRFYKDELGYVVLEGMAAGGTITGSIFTLPVGFRPPSNGNVYQSVVSNNALGVVEVQSGGAVIPQVGNNTHFSLWGVRFRPA
jgi:hypothetical protein